MNADSACAVIISDSSAAFQSPGYAGGLEDRATGLVRFGARDYEPGVGRWTSKDPARFRGHGPNLMSYAGNAPTFLFDPTGEAWIGRRPLGSLPDFIDAPGSLFDKCNCETIHEEVFFDDGTRPHFGLEPGFAIPTPDLDYPGNRDKYVPEPGHYEDNLMRDAMDQTSTSSWNFFGNQCQNYMARLRATYWRLYAERRKQGGVPWPAH